MPRRKRVPVTFDGGGEWEPKGWRDPWVVQPSVEWPAGPTGSLEADHAADVAAVESAFARRAKDEQARRADATDGRFYACLVFASAAEVDAFMISLGLPADARHILGAKVAAAISKE